MTDDWRAHLDGRRVVAAISGGKDSAAMSLWLTEQGIEHDRVFADTGWEHEWTYRYLWDVLVPKLGPITIVRGAYSFVELCRKKAGFPFRMGRWCTQELKFKPIQRHLAQYEEDIVDAIGIRAGESQTRAQMSEWEWSADLDCEIWRPLLTWSEDDVIACHKRHNLPPNPLYLMGASRVGCWPCIYARKSEIALIAELDPMRIDEIRALEREVGEGAKARYAARGETLESLGYNSPSFFQRGTQAGGMMPIDEVVQWSRTSHGGKQYELFATGEPGCVRWGMCESMEGAPE